MSAWDITQATYDGVFLNVSGAESSPSGIAFSADGTKMYVAGPGADAVSAFELSVPWEVDSGTFLASFSVIDQQNNLRGVDFKPDGTKMYITGDNFSAGKLHAYDLGTAWDVTTAVYNSETVTVHTETPYPYGVRFKPDGTKMYLTDGAWDDVDEYVLSTAWDVSTATYSTKIYVGSQEGAPYSLFFKPDGLKMYVIGRSADAIIEYDLSTAWLVSSATYNGVSKSVLAQTGQPQGLAFSPDGLRVYVVGNVEDTVFQYDIPIIPTGDIAVTLEDTTASIIQIGGDLITTLEDTTASASGLVVISGTLGATLGNTRATFLGEIRRWSESHTLDSEAAASTEPSWAAKFLLGSLASNPVETFYNPAVELQLSVQGVLDDLAAFVEQENLQASASSTITGASNTTVSLTGESTGAAELLYNPRPELTLSALATLKQLAAYVQVPELQAQAGITAEARSASAFWLAVRASDTLETDLQHFAELTLEAIAGAGAVEAFAAVVDEIGSASSSIAGLYALSVLDNMAADLIEQNTLIVGVEETLAGEAGDSVQALGSYFANAKDMAGAWLVLKTSGEVVQGWVMNVEGERPISEYTNFEFNSMTRIGDKYFAASDEGLHVLGGDTDSGADIDAKVSTMMLDFGTTAQKRVVAAYLGYTSTGTVVLKVRSVDDGQLVEHWYEAQEVRADAPREGYKPLGRGLKSRYWQFELANVDGADFELDKLELQPLKLRRRV